MRQKSSKQTLTGDLQNQFTAYLVTAVRHKKHEYKCKQEHIEHYESPTDFQTDFVMENPVSDMLKNLPLLMQIENMALLYALSQLSERDRNILLAKALNGYTLKDLAKEMGMPYSSVASAYERAVQKIRTTLKKGKDDLA